MNDTANHRLDYESLQHSIHPTTHFGPLLLTNVEQRVQAITSNHKNNGVATQNNTQSLWGGNGSLSKGTSVLFDFWISSLSFTQEVTSYL